LKRIFPFHSQLAVRFGCGGKHGFDYLGKETIEPKRDFRL
jgi:hypothetical protein